MNHRVGIGTIHGGRRAKPRPGGRTVVVYGTVVAASVIAVLQGYIQGGAWADGAARAAVSAAMASRQGTGNLAWVWELEAGLEIAAGALLFGIIPGVIIGFAARRARRVAVLTLIVGAAAGLYLGYVASVGVDGSGVTHPERLQAAHADYVVADRRGRDLPPLPASEVGRLPLPAGLADEIDMPGLPNSPGGLVLLLIPLGLGSIGGYALGSALRRKPRS